MKNIFKKEKRFCRRCGTQVEVEKIKSLKKQYPYFCPNCDENMFDFEVFKESDVNNYE